MTLFVSRYRGLSFLLPCVERPFFFGPAFLAVSLVFEAEEQAFIPFSCPAPPLSSVFSLLEL